MFLYLFSLKLILGELDTIFPYNCSEYICKADEISNDQCNPLCMIPACNYDSSEKYTKTWFLRFQLSDCYSLCKSSGCKLETLEKSCDPSCNIPECGFGLGACGYCAPGCTKQMLLNNICDPQCNTRACMYDNNACGWCAPNCFKNDLTLSTCKKECSGPECNFQDLVCDTAFCAPGCSPSMQNDAKCDNECNNEMCKYDNWKCACSEGCTYNKLFSVICYDECNNADCHFQKGVCGHCAPGCYEYMIGDAQCNDQCNNKACGFDSNDCSCAAGCRSQFQPKTLEWFWDTDDNGCKAECLVEACLFNYQVCKNANKIRAAWFQQISVQDMRYTLNLSACFSNHPQCTEEILWEIDQSGVCNEHCNNADCLGCMGLSDSILSCSRAFNSHCLLCSKSIQVYDFCYNSKECPPGFRFIEGLSDAIFEGELCFRDPIVYSKNNPYKVYVSDYGNDENDGSIENPIKSLSLALQLCTREFNLIQLTGENYKFTLFRVVNPLVLDAFSPLKLATNIDIQDITIQGNLEKRSIVYLVEDNMKFETKSLSFQIKYVDISGQYALNKNCGIFSCMYCPTLILLNEIIINDREEIIKDLYNYGTNCNNFHSTNFISISAGTSLKLYDVYVYYFQQQLRSFIYAEGSVELSFVNFYNIQSYELSYFITLVCKSDCSNTLFRYTDGWVENLNNGYEYTDLIVQPGFLSIEGMESLVILNVSFGYVQVMTGSNATTINSLINVKNLIGKITISNCLFVNAFVNRVINIDSSSLSYTNFTLDQNLVIEQYSGWHLSIISTDFYNITSIECVLCFTMGTVTQSVKLGQVSFYNIVSSGQGIVNILSESKFNSLAENGGLSFVIIENQLTRNRISNRNIFLYKVRFENIAYGGNLISITNQPNIEFEGLSLIHVESFSTDLINEYTLNQFRNNPNQYLGNVFRPGQVISTKCGNLIELNSASDIKISYLSIDTVTCKEGDVGIVVEGAKSLSGIVINANIIYGKFESDLFSFSSIKNIELRDLNFKDISENLASVLRIYECSNVILSKFTGSTMLAFFRHIVSLEKVANIKISDFFCYNCGTVYANGGALYILPNTTESSINITGFECNYCNSWNGLGAAIYVDSYSALVNHNLTINNAKFYLCAAVDGAALYISNKFSIKSGLLNNLLIDYCLSETGAAFTDLHKQGHLMVNNITFKENYGYYSGIKASFSASEPMLSLNQVFIKDSDPLYSVFYFNHISSGGSVSLKSVNILSNTVKMIYANNIIINATSITIGSGEGIYLENAIFNGNDIQFMRLSGNAVNSINSIFTCNKCSFKSIISGPVLFIEERSSFNITSSVFSDNYSKDSGIVLFLSGCNDASIFYDCTFSSNLSPTASLFEIQASVLSLSNCKIQDTVSAAPSPGIYLLSSTLFLTNSTLLRQKGNLGGFLYLSTYSSVEAYNTSFESGTANNGGVVFSILSTFKATLCRFINNQNSINIGTGGALYGTTSSNFTLISCQFIDNFSPSSGSSIEFSGNNLIITNSFFSASNANCFIISLNNVNSFLFENSLITGIGYGISSEASKDLTLSNSLFKDLHGAFVATSSIQAKSNVYLITSCEFIGNSAVEFGGALNLNEISLVIKDSLFRKNSASSGGAINYACPEYSCVFNISNSIFKENIATIQGGGIKWADRKPTYSNTSFINNSALYGADSSSFAAILSLSSISRSLTSFECAPGQDCNTSIILEIKDSSGNTMTLDNSSKATMNSLNQSYSISGDSQKIASMGRFTFENYVISGPPDTEVNVSITTADIDTSIAEVVGDTIKYINSVNVSIKLRHCIIGEQITATACIPCEVNNYVIEPALRCNTCPIGGNCTGGWRIYPLPGYWKSKDVSEVVYSCPNRGACLGAMNDTDFIGSCFEGYAGNKCFGCSSGYSRTGSNECAKCPDRVRNTFILIAVLIFYAFQGTVMIFTTIKAAYSKKSLYSIYLKIFTNYLQLIFLINQLDLRWPWFVLELFSAQNSVVTASDQVFSFDCYLRGDHDDYSSILFKKLIFMASLPLVVWITSLLVWIIICFKKKDWGFLKQEYFTSMIVLFFLFYPGIVKIMFSVFSCVYISESGYWMTDNLQVRCWDVNENKNLIIIAISSIIVWAIGIPFIVLILLYKNRKKCNELRIKIIFGFLFNGYKSNTYYWEFIVMLRKIIIICITVFMAQISKAAQGLTLVILLLISLTIQDRLKPFNLPQLNHMDIEGILTATLTIYCGLFYVSNDAGTELSVALFVIIVAGNVYFVTYWLYYMVGAVLDLLSTKIEWFRKLAGKKDYYQDYTLDEKIVKEGVFTNRNEGHSSYTLFKKHNNRSKVIYMKGIKNAKALQQKVVAAYF